MIIRNELGEFETIDFRETAPTAAHRDMFKGDLNSSMIGGLSFGIPGEIRGFERAHSKYGKLPWKSLFEPSVVLAEKGWKVNRILAEKIQLIRDYIDKDTELKRVFAPHGTLLKEGDIIKRIKYAHTLSVIARDGPSAFYEGWIADAIIETVQRTGGIATAEDMKKYNVKEGKPLIGRYRDRKIATTPLPTGGPVFLSILNILEGFDLGRVRDTQYFHRVVESFKFGYAQRAYYGDPVYCICSDCRDTVYRNISTIMMRFISKQVATENRNKIVMNTTLPLDKYNPSFEQKEDHGTMHISVLDKNGAAVSLTSTVNLLFGSKTIEPKTGIVLNNEMDDFSVPGRRNAFGYEPSPYNYVQPFKRPLSSSVPVIIEHNGRVEMVLGASGGSRITTSTLLTMLNIIQFGMNMYPAIEDSMRIHHQLLPNQVVVESGFPYSIQRELEDLGHGILRLQPGVYHSGVSGIRVLADGTLEAASDPRKGGLAAGF